MKLASKPQLSKLVASSALLIGTLLLFPTLTGSISGLSTEMSKGAGLAVITIAFLATGIIPEYMTALLFFLVAMLFDVAPAQIIFSGFHSTALWLVFGGLVVGVSIISTGLGKRIARRIVDHLQGSYLRLITGMTFVGLAFAFLMPSAMGRVVLLIPIAIVIAEHFGFKKGSKGRIGVVLAITLGTFLPAFSILPSNVANMILAGMAESQFAVEILYGEYLLLNFPILGLLKTGLIIFTIAWLYPDIPVVTEESELHEIRPFSRKELILALVLIVMLILWLTDFIHHISPAWIALTGALVIMLPKIEIISQQDFNQKVSYGSLFFVAGILGLGSLLQYSGLGVMVGQKMVAMLPLTSETPFTNFIAVASASTFSGLAVTLPGIPAIFTPLSGQIVTVTNMEIESVLMLQVLGFSTMWFPYQAPPVVIALHMAGARSIDAIKPFLILALISLLILFPMSYLWWRILGWI